MASARTALALLGTIIVTQAGVARGAAAARNDVIVCSGSRMLQHTVGIAIDRQTGKREQTLVEGRLAIVRLDEVIGTLYVDDQGMRYVELRPNVMIDGIDPGANSAVQPLEPNFMFDADVRLRACRESATT